MAVTATAQVARMRWWPAGLALALWALFVVGMLLVAWLDRLLRQTGRPDLVQWTAEDAVYAVLGLVSAATVGRWWPAAGPTIRWAGYC